MMKALDAQRREAEDNAHALIAHVQDEQRQMHERNETHVAALQAERGRVADEFKEVKEQLDVQNTCCIMH